jgi:hypothetical protein
MQYIINTRWGQWWDLKRNATVDDVKCVIEIHVNEDQRAPTGFINLKAIHDPDQKKMMERSDRKWKNVTNE